MNTRLTDAVNHHDAHVFIKLARQQMAGKILRSNTAAKQLLSLCITPVEIIPGSTPAAGNNLSIKLFEDCRNHLYVE